MKVSEEIMDILKAYDDTRSLRAAAEQCGCSPHTVKRYVELRAQGRLGDRVKRPRESIIEPFRPHLEEWVADSGGRVRGDVCFQRLRRLNYKGSYRTVRRALAEIKRTWRKDHRRILRPWITEPGKWAQWDWGEGPRVNGERSYLFCAWLAFSRYRVVIPARDTRLPTLIACLDRAMRAFGGAPSYWLTDNPRTVTTTHVAGIDVRHPDLARVGRHYGCRILACQPHDPQSKGGSEATVKIAKADIVPTDANLLGAYASWEELEDGCEAFLVMVNNREHSVTCRVPNQVLAEEREVLHPLPSEPFTAAFGVTRRVTDMAVVNFGRARYSVPHRFAEESVWVREEGGELVIVADDDGLREVARHPLRDRGQASIDKSHYGREPEGPLNRRPRPRNDVEKEFLAIGPNAERWLRAAAACGTPKLPAMLAEIVDVSRLAGKEDVDLALGVAAECERFGFGDIASIAAAASLGPMYRADGESFLQGGTGAWKDFGQNGHDRGENADDCGETDR